MTAVAKGQKQLPLKDKTIGHEQVTSATTAIIVQNDYKNIYNYSADELALKQLINSKRVSLNVSGLRVEISWRALERLPDSRLGGLRQCKSLSELAAICDNYRLVPPTTNHFKDDFRASKARGFEAEVTSILDSDENYENEVGTDFFHERNFDLGDSVNDAKALDTKQTYQCPKSKTTFTARANLTETIQQFSIL